MIIVGFRIYKDRQNHYLYNLKLIFLIFSMYLLVLPSITCIETDMCTGDLQSEVTQKDNYPKNENEPEDCGSFCTCSCCMHIVSVNYQFAEIEISKTLVSTQLHFFYNNISLPSNYFGNIWQPPKSV